SSATTGWLGSGLTVRIGVWGSLGSFAAGAGGSCASAATLGMAAAGGVAVGAMPGLDSAAAFNSAIFDSATLGSCAGMVSGAVTPASGPVATTAAGDLASIGLTSTT